MDGVISVKSDVFSFGVIMLEILTGKKNRGYYEKNHQLNLLGHVSNFFFLNAIKTHQSIHESLKHIISIVH